MSTNQACVIASPAGRSIKLRRVTEQDEPFLFHIYKLSRVEEFSMTGIGESQFDLLMRMQYSARKATYEGNYPDSCHCIVSVDGKDAGQLWVFRDETQYRVIDIAIAGEFQNHGIGGSLMKDLIVQAKQAGVFVRCSVATNNPGSLRFHQRLGFRIVNSNEAYYQMEYADESGTPVAA
jgi:ribosomal protein S18 acetylase RimI-like enzyme